MWQHDGLTLSRLLLLELLVQAIEFLHFLNALSVFLFRRYLFSFFNDSFASHLRGFGGCTYLIDNIRVNIVFERWWIKLFQAVPDLFLGCKLQEILEPIPLVIVNVDWQLRVSLLIVFIAQKLPILRQTCLLRSRLCRGLISAGLGTWSISSLKRVHTLPTGIVRYLAWLLDLIECTSCILCAMSV